MCDRCKSAGDELRPFLKQLVEKYPGTEVEHDGQVHPVSRVHHVFTALLVETKPIVEEEMTFHYEQALLNKAFEKGKVAAA